MIRRALPSALVVGGLAFLVEWSVLLFLRHRLPVLVSPLVFFGASVLVCVALYRHLERSEPVAEAQGSTRARPRAALLYLVGLACAVGLLAAVGRVISENPVNAGFSDIVPAISIYVERAVSGEQVYAPITEFGYEIVPNYLTLQWLPFALTELAGMDYRWMPIGVFVIGYLAYVHQVAIRRRPMAEEVTKVALPGVMVGTLIVFEPLMLAHTVELMVVGFYYIACASLFSRSTVVRGLALALPLLSRYALIAWLPVYLAVTASRERWRTAAGMLGVVAVAALALYVVPFMLGDPEVFVRGLDYYTAVAIGEWQHFGSPGRTYHVHNGLGFAVYVYEFWPGSIADRVNVVRIVHLIASTSMAVIAGLWYFARRPDVDHRLYALVALNLCVATFYFFIQVPYAYVVILSGFLSAFVLGLVPWEIPLTGAASGGPTDQNASEVDATGGG